MESVFEISINDKTKGLIIRTYKWGLFLFVSAFVISIGTALLSYIEYRTYEKMFADYPQPVKMQSYVHWIHAFLYSVGLPLQGFFVFQFIAKARKALTYRNAEDFNQSFS